VFRQKFAGFSENRPRGSVFCAVAPKIRPFAAIFRLILQIFGRAARKIEQFGRFLAKIRQNSAKFGRFSQIFGRAAPFSARFRPNFGRLPPNFASFRSFSAARPQNSNGSAVFWRPKSEKTAKNMPSKQKGAPKGRPGRMDGARGQHKSRATTQPCHHFAAAHRQQFGGARAQIATARSPITRACADNDDTATHVIRSAPPAIGNCDIRPTISARAVSCKVMWSLGAHPTTPVIGGHVTTANDRRRACHPCGCWDWIEISTCRDVNSPLCGSLVNGGLPAITPDSQPISRIN
jgi:hypothetical protein